MSDTLFSTAIYNVDQELGVYLERTERNAGQIGRYRLGNVYLPALSPVKALFIYLSLMQQKGTALAVSSKEIKQALLATLARNKYKIQDIPLRKTGF
ncbi:MAG: putative transcriptional regulator [Peptococcaceae bacterium]|jgi:hypothetical protein|nr:putative transcriptional regulator [Peptococcaceae bacterium]